MITVKEYADSRNKSVQAVYKQLHREKNRTRLEGHLLKQNRMTYLDEEAIKILQEVEGIGTEATRANIIETLKQKEYIKVDKNKKKT